jgi:hypothetical protein
MPKAIGMMARGPLSRRRAALLGSAHAHDVVSRLCLFNPASVKVNCTSQATSSLGHGPRDFRGSSTDKSLTLWMRSIGTVDCGLPSTDRHRVVRGHNPILVSRAECSPTGKNDTITHPVLPQKVR